MQVNRLVSISIEFLLRPIFERTSFSLLLTLSRETCTQPAITCSKLTLETLQQGGKYAQS